MVRTVAKQKVKIPAGSLIKVWWSTGTLNNMATVIAVLPYDGTATKFGYDCVLRLTASNTYRGYLDMVYNSSDFKYEPKE